MLMAPVPKSQCNFILVFGEGATCPIEFWLSNHALFHANTMTPWCDAAALSTTFRPDVKLWVQNVLCPLQGLLRHPLALPLEPKTTRVKALNGSQWENTAASVTTLLRAEYHKGKCLHVLASVTSQFKLLKKLLYIFFVFAGRYFSLAVSSDGCKVLL